MHAFAHHVDLGTQLGSKIILPMDVSFDEQIAEAFTGLKAAWDDLDIIVMRAIARDRERRYQTASAMADDLQRRLADEPILARNICEMLTLAGHTAASAETPNTRRRSRS